MGQERSPGRWIRSRLPSAFDVAKLSFRLFGMPDNMFGSIDATQKCNLRCRHCYFFENARPEHGLAVDEWLDVLASWKRVRSRLEFPFFQCSWVGGEPLLRPELIERGRRFFRYNLVVTNGTLPLPDWPEVDFYVSVDGDEEVHEDIRGKRGIYRLIRQNISAASRSRLTLSCCISRQNAHCIESLVEEWWPLVSGFTFDFYTPTKGTNDPLWLPWPERDRLVDRLLVLRRKYPDRLRTTENTLNLMREANASHVTRQCLFARKGFAYDAAGRPKGKCTMGDMADCSRCGCIVPFYLHSLVHGRQKE